MKTIGQRIASLRKNAYMSQAELMRVLEFDNLGKYETNARLPSIDIIIKLSNFFNVSTDWILTGIEKADRKSEEYNEEVNTKDANCEK